LPLIREPRGQGEWRIAGILGGPFAVFIEPEKGSVEEVAGEQNAGHKNKQQPQVEAGAIEFNRQGVWILSIIYRAIRPLAFLEKNEIFFNSFLSSSKKSNCRIGFLISLTLITLKYSCDAKLSRCEESFKLVLIDLVTFSDQ
jgi:hypothetical protein